MRTLPFLLLALFVAAAAFFVGAVTDPFARNATKRVVGTLDPEAPQLTEQLARVRSKLTEQASELNDLRQERMELQQELSSARAEIEQLRSKMQETETARDQARARATELESQIADRTRQAQAEETPSVSAAGRDEQSAGMEDTGDTAERTVAADTASLANAQPGAKARRAINPTAEQGNELLAGVEAYQAENYRSAYEIWLPLAQQGYARAQLHVGALFFEGNGVPQNDVLAQAWLMLADSNGSRNAVELLERLEGRMSEQDMATAREMISGVGN